MSRLKEEVKRLLFGLMAAFMEGKVTREAVKISVCLSRHVQTVS